MLAQSLWQTLKKGHFIQMFQYYYCLSRQIVIHRVPFRWLQEAESVFEIVLGTLVDIRSTNVPTFGGPALILVDHRNMQYRNKKI